MPENLMIGLRSYIYAIKKNIVVALSVTDETDAVLTLSLDKTDKILTISTSLIDVVGGEYFSTMKKARFALKKRG